MLGASASFPFAPEPVWSETPSRWCGLPRPTFQAFGQDVHLLHDREGRPANVASVIATVKPVDRAIQKQVGQVLSRQS